MRRRQAELLQPQLLARMPEATRRRVQTTVDATRDELEQRIRSERLRLQPRIDSLTNALRGLDEQQNREIAAIASRTEFQPSFSRRAVLMYRRIWYSYPLSFALGALFLLPVWMRLRGEYLYDRLVAAEVIGRSRARMRSFFDALPMRCSDTR
ncbi:MAG: hypothetical protein IPF98_22720 [Gemmatimonadetes bacterium]|nr:hypothetical protein [Gemmatimonadota bacterium]